MLPADAKAPVALLEADDGASEIREAILAVVRRGDGSEATDAGVVESLDKAGGSGRR